MPTMRVLLEVLATVAAFMLGAQLGALVERSRWQHMIRVIKLADKDATDKLKDVVDKLIEGM